MEPICLVAVVTAAGIKLPLSLTDIFEDAFCERNAQGTWKVGFQWVETARTTGGMVLVSVQYICFIPVKGARVAVLM